MASKRTAESAPKDTAVTSKKFRSAIDESSNELMCPITYQLPLDPVLAEDGKIYERKAVKNWLKQHQRSPVTNLPMGTKLIAATHVKNMIEVMVKSGALSDEKTVEWKQRIQQQEKLAELSSKAANGDAEAAFALGKCYKFGSNGAEKDEVKAFDFYKQASEAGHAFAMGELSHAYKIGRGVATNNALALRWAAAAHHLGNGIGSRVLSRLYMEGCAGLPIDMNEGFKLKKLACERNCTNSVGFFNLASMYESGVGTAVDLDQAAHWMRKAVKLNSPEHHAQLAREWLIARDYLVEEDA